MAGQDNIVLRHLVWHDTCGGCHSSLTPSGLVALSRKSMRGVNLLNVYFKMTCKSVRWRKSPSIRPAFPGVMSSAWSIERGGRGADRVRGDNMLRLHRQARWRRLLESSAGTTPGGGARHRWAAPPRPSPPPPAIREGCMSQSTPGARRTPPVLRVVDGLVRRLPQFPDQDRHQ